MSHLSKNLFSKLNTKYNHHKPGESTSNRSGQNVGDSILTMEDQPMTNNRVFSRTVAGTFLGLILVLALSVFCGVQDTYAAASSLSVSVSAGQDPSVNVAPTADGRFIASGATTFSVETTHAAGYKVTASSTALKDSTNTISTHSVTSGVTASEYENNNYGSVDLNNTWGYLPSKICTTSGTTTTCAANTLYLPAPISATQTLDEVSSATGNTYDISIGTRVTTDTAQGAYATTFTVAVVGNATPYAITYNKNTTDTVSNMPTNHTTSDTGASGETVTLASNAPTRSNYDFQGWCTVAVADGASCTGASYAKGATWTLNQTSTTNSLTLYAMWKTQATYMQNWSGCSSMSTGATVTLTDNRDNEKYLIGKLADGKCWMLDNLRLNPATATLTTANTHMKSGTTPTYTNGSTNSFTAAQFNANYKDNTTTGYGSGSKKVGVYYNFCAASAGTICTSSNFSDASHDLCPAGWKMPSQSEYSTLSGKYSSTTATNANSLQYNLSTPLSGYFYNSSQNDLGSYGYFWSSTRSNDTRMYRLYVNASDVGPASIDIRGAGFSMRCVAQ